MNLYTIGFTGKSADRFFGLLKASKATILIDIRINRNSQLAGFTKEQDLGYFLLELVGMKYLIREDLAPTKELLTSYRNKEITWDKFAEKYQQLMVERGVMEKLSEEEFENAVLLCSEDEPEKCHRTLLANLLVEKYPGTKVTNLI